MIRGCKVINFLKRRLPIKFFKTENLAIFKFGSLSHMISENFFKHYIPDINIHHRVTFLLDICRNRNLLHIGFLDAPITTEKISSGEFLHTKLSSVATSNYGVDIDLSSMSEYRNISGDLNNSVIDILQSDFDVTIFKNRFDVILLPEVLEHLPNPGMALVHLGNILDVNPGSLLVITVPNAFSKEHFAAAASSVEMVHPDHYYYFSPITLKKLLKDSGFVNVEIGLYSHTENIQNSIGITSNGIIAVCTK